MSCLNWKIESQKYVEELLHKDIEEIENEPSKLLRESQSIHLQMEDLVFNNYNDFIKTYDCINLINNELVLVNEKSENILSNKLDEKCRDFSKKAKTISKSRTINSITLKLHPVILELLEIPQLIDTCVKNQHYDEALELEKFVNRIEMKFKDIEVISDIVKNAKHSILIMVNQIHHQLSADIDLPSCIKAIGYLKRLSIYNDKEIKVVFLQCRGEYLNKLRSAIDKSNPFTYISKIIDINRTHIINIVNQYNALFSINESDEYSYENYDSILSSWINFEVSQFLDSFQKIIKTINDNSSINILKNQCQFFSKVMCRIGADFSPLLNLIFENKE